MTDVLHDPDRRRFEAVVDGHTAELTYALDGNRLVLIHTGVPQALEGHGVGGALVTAAIDHAAGLGLVVEPRCSFAQEWLKRHPDVAGRASIEWPPS